MVIGSALAAHYLIEYKATRKYLQVFKSYTSDEQARQMAEDEVSLELGGHEVETTIFFSDLAGFTSMSEGLSPEAVSNALISYFGGTTKGVLDEKGTIIKYIGDAVVATWGAPLKVDREADRSILAAIAMQIAGRAPIVLETEDGPVERVLETRVGINHGVTLAGNLGSSRRFDWTVIGDNVNLAARLEGLNKMLGSSILITDSVLSNCEERDRFDVRRMGKFIVKGRQEAVEVFEVLGDKKTGSVVRSRSEEYLTRYAEALDAFERKDLEEAKAGFEDCLGQHDLLEVDPASKLFLATIEDTSTIAMEWLGAVALDSK